MKGLLTLLFTLGLLALNGQTLQDDFEGNGNISTWFGDACAVDLNKSNPHAQGINTSAAVLEYHDQGGQYANLRFDAPNNLDIANHAIFSVKVYVPSSGLTGNQPNQISCKLQDGTQGSPWQTQTEIIKPLVLDQWQTITFDFANDPFINLDPSSLPPVQRTDLNRVLFQLNGENNNDEVLAYLDDFLYVDTTNTGGGTGGGTYNFTQLVWSDEFNGTGMIDTSKWFHQTQLPNGNSWYNGEIQHYTDRTANTQVSNGTMKLIAKKETYSNQGVTKQYTSARLNSKYAFTYGRIEVRAILPQGSGTWPAIWMLGKNISEPGAYWQQQGFGTTPWPACGEIDIMEHWGTNQDFVQSAMHTPSSFGGTVNKGGRVIPGVSNTFHTYALEWTPTKMIFSVDSIVHYTYEPATRDASTWPFDDPQYILLNIAIEPGIDPTWQEDTMEIDYVRIYQDPSMALIDHQQRPELKAFPNPCTDELQIELPSELRGEMELELVATNGQVLRRDHFSRNEAILKMEGLGDLQPGVYFIKLKGQESQQSLRFIKR